MHLRDSCALSPHSATVPIRIPNGYTASSTRISPSKINGLRFAGGRYWHPREVRKRKGNQKTTLVRSAKFESLKPSSGAEIAALFGSAGFFDHTGDDDLDAIGAFVAAVAIAAFARLGVSWRIAFEVGAGEVVKKDFEFCVEEILPAITEVLKEFAFVL